MDHLSCSQLNLYSLCSLKYRYQYVDQLPKLFKSSALVFGGAIHAALAWFHKQQVKGNGIQAGQLLQIFRADWYAQRLDAEIRYKDGETEESLLAMGSAILNLYFVNPQDGIRGSEIPFAVPLVDPVTGEEVPVGLEGFIDLVAEEDTVVEFKTSARPMSRADADDHLQLSAYSYAYWMLHDRPVKTLRIVNFTKAARPRMVVVETQRKAHDHRQFVCVAAQVYKAIQAGVFYPRRGYWCGDCEFYQPCHRQWPKD